MDGFKLITKDNKKIAYDYYEARLPFAGSGENKPKGWIIFLHMMPATKESWRALAEKFRENGYSSVAIDLRGHGESDGGPEGYKKFNDLEHQKSVYDIDAAVEFLKTRPPAGGAIPEKIFLVGASIGANLSLQYIAEHPEFKTAVLLSPGLNYRGIETLPLVRRLRPGQKVFFVSSEDDVRSGGNNAEQNRELFEAVPAGVVKKIQVYKRGGHGTTMLEKEAGLADLIINFVENGD